MSDNNEMNPVIEPVDPPVAKRGRPPKDPVVKAPAEEVLVAEADTEYLSPQTLAEMEAGRKAIGRV